MQATVIDKCPATMTTKSSTLVRVESSSLLRPPFANKATTTDIIACDSKHILDNVRVIHLVDWLFDINIL
jgi:hypothetical protein